MPTIMRLEARVKGEVAYTWNIRVPFYNNYTFKVKTQMREAFVRNTVESYIKKFEKIFGLHNVEFVIVFESKINSMETIDKD